MKKLILVFMFLLVSCEGNEYEARGELYQCFVDGEAVYKSNIRPVNRGGGWVLLNGKSVKVDDCFCMGCIGF